MRRDETAWGRLGLGLGFGFLPAVYRMFIAWPGYALCVYACCFFFSIVRCTYSPKVIRMRIIEYFFLSYPHLFITFSTPVSLQRAPILLSSTTRLTPNYSCKTTPKAPAEPWFEESCRDPRAISRAIPQISESQAICRQCLLQIHSIYAKHYPELRSDEMPLRRWRAVENYCPRAGNQLSCWWQSSLHEMGQSRETMSSCRCTYLYQALWKISKR